MFSNDNLCFSGGATGADLAWGRLAKAHGHSVIHFSFKGHKTDADPQEVYVLSEEELQEADEHLIKASKTLNRYFPAKKYFVANLLRRNYYQVKWTQSIYAVGTIGKSGRTGVNGGTAWAIEMGLNLNVPAIFFFDQDKGHWLKWNHSNHEWIKTQPTPPTGYWTGIGTRDLNETGKTAIEKLFG